MPPGWPANWIGRGQLLNGDVLGLAGPGEEIAGVLTCTKIYEADLADQVLDHEKCPEWQAECTKLIYSFPTNERLWQQSICLVDVDDLNLFEVGDHIEVNWDGVVRAWIPRIAAFILLREMRISSFLANWLRTGKIRPITRLTLRLQPAARRKIRPATTATWGRRLT